VPETVAVGVFDGELDSDCVVLAVFVVVGVLVGVPVAVAVSVVVEEPLGVHVFVSELVGV
jgi:hypothetical protein